MPEAQTERTDTLEHAVSQLMKGSETEDKAEETLAKSEDSDNQESEPEEHEPQGDEQEDENLEAQEEEEEESEDETEEEEPEYFAVKIDGEEYQVTLDELQSGYQRQKDYTRKTQQLADQRKDYESKLGELTQEHEDFMTRANMANELLNRDLKKFDGVDWDKLKADDPVGYVQKQIEKQETVGLQQELYQQVQKIQAHNLQQQQQQRDAYLQSQAQEAEKLFPEWKVEDKRKIGIQTIAEYAKTQGYTDQELAGIVSAKDFLILDKARKYDEMQKTKGNIRTKKRPGIKKVVKAKGAPSKTVGRKKAVQARKERFQQSGSLKDAAAFMHEMRSGQVVEKPRR
jgi:hypothetical protein